MKHRITQTLLNSWSYIFKAPEGYESNATESFLATLRRETQAPTQNMIDGIEFEDAVVAYATDGTETYDARFGDTYKTVANSVRGGQFQVVGCKYLVVDGEEYQVYGRADAIKAGTCYDIKYVHNYDVGRFIDSSQHSIYLYLFDTCRDFCYVISCHGQFAAYERYDRSPDSTGDAEEATKRLIAEFIAYLKTHGLYEIYCEHWVEKHDENENIESTV